MAAATDLGAALDAKVTVSGATEVSGEGDKYLIEKSSTKIHVGNGLLDVVSATVDEDELPTLLADGKYIDDDNDEFDYTQKLTLTNLTVTMFDDNDYKENSPTVGIKIANGASVLNYTLEMSDTPLWSDLATSDLPMMGKEYYVLSATNASTSINVLTLLDSAEKVVLAEGETKTVTAGGKSYEVSISYITSSTVKLSVNGQVTNSLAAGQTYKLSDGAYVGIREVLARDVAGVIGQVEFGIGSGKLKLTQGTDTEMNDNSIPGLTAYVKNSSDGKLTSITLEWKADGDLFIAPNSEPVIPGFKNIKLTWAGLTLPAEENIVVKAGGDDYVSLEDFPLKDSTEDINLVYSSDRKNYTGIGKDSDNLLRTSRNSSLKYDADTDDYFIASWTDSKDAESYLIRATGFKIEDGINKTTFEYRKDGSWVQARTDRKATDSVTIGNVDLTVGQVDYSGKSVTLAAGSGVTFNELYSKEGFLINLPWINYSTYTIVDNTPTCTSPNVTALMNNRDLVSLFVTNASDASKNVTCYNATYTLRMWEKDKDGDIGGTSASTGNNFNLTLGFNSASNPQVSVTDIVGEEVSASQIGSTKVYRTMLYSDLATEMLWDKTGDQYFVKVINHGGEVMAKVYLTSSTVSSSSSDKIKVVKDSEINSVKDKNLVVVGGSCINTVAATLLGSSSPMCGAAFTTKTGVGADKYLIQVLASPYNAEKVAMLVAGYEAADTAAAVAKVKEGNVATSVGTKVIGPVLG
jgi:hypothetical protein